MIRRIFTLIIACLPILIIVLFAIRIGLANSLAALGSDVQKIDDKIAFLAEENDALRQQIASASSLLTITQRAQALGFVEPAKDQVMTMVQDQFPVALK